MSQKNHWPRTGVERPLPCEQRQAFGTAQRRSHAAKLEALQRKALEVSQGLQGLELCETHLGTPAAFPESPHGTSKHLYIYISYIIHPDPSSSSSPSLSDILICPQSSVLRHPSSIFVQSRIRLSPFIMLASKTRTPRGIQVQGLNTTRQMRHQILQMLATEMLQSCKGQLHLTARGLISCVTIITSSHGITLTSKIYRYTVPRLGSPGPGKTQKCDAGPGFGTSFSALVHLR